MPRYGTGLVAAGVVARTALWLLVAFGWAAAALAGQEPYRVLVLNSFRQSLPVNTDWYTGILKGFKSRSASDLRIDIDIEALDVTRYSEAGYLTALMEVYRRKYTGNAPHLIIPTYTQALAFILEHREALFPGVPIVFCGADTEFVHAQALGPRITGITSHTDIAGTAKLALQLHPGARQMAVIIGSDPFDGLIEARARRALQPFADRIAFIWLRGMVLEELIAAVHELPPDIPILYLIQLKDRTGMSHTPFYTTGRLASVANAPIYGLWDTLVGNGIVGGRLVTVEDDGFQAAQMGLRILRGEAPEAIPIAFRTANPAIVDGRELARWRIDEDRLPADAQIRYRQRPIWEEHSAEIITGVVIVVLQGLLIVALMLNRRRLRHAQVRLADEYGRRIGAEALASQLRARLARFSKERSLGVMATTIAHEINQPLLAIQNYAQAVRRRLQNNVGDKSKLIALVAKIEGQAERAGAITQHVRTLVGKDAAVLRPTPIWRLVQDVIGMMGSEAEHRGCRITCEGAGHLPTVLADPLQVQLVLVNLVQNAMQSICSTDRDDKPVAVEVRPRDDREVQVSVTDRGAGVPLERVAEIFEPLYSSKSGGMGMGLAISKAIIEAHGGRLWYEPNPAGGAIFRFTLRAVGS